MIDHLALFVILLVLINLYFILAKKLNVVDIPNQRSSHQQSTIRGGGIIFLIAILAYLIIYQDRAYYLIIATALLGVFSFIDDIRNLHSLVRLSVQLVAIVLLLIHLDYLDYHLVLFVFIIFVATGFINVYNFMDGINGITVLYSLSVLIPLYWINSSSSYLPVQTFTFPTLSLIVFGFYNVRKKAICFSGDVGSVVMGFFIAFLLLTLIQDWNSIIPIIFVAVYGVDAVFTVLIRIVRKENILKAHRSHLYQLLSNERGIPHILTSSIYAFVQLIVSFSTVIIMDQSQMNPWLLTMLMLLTLSVLYWLVRLWVDERLLSQ
jgi:UDP-N-acetylmuramyl pentapeptide phosphotransferase/UDP-N-acetylglucosamine-1-phosphate transferase